MNEWNDMPAAAAAAQSSHWVPESTHYIVSVHCVMCDEKDRAG